MGMRYEDLERHLVRAGAEIERLKAALAARSSPEWQPIETAPKDGTEILACWDAPTPEYKARGLIRWDHNCWITTLGYWEKEPTHWQRLPATPVDVEQQSTGSDK
jgi:hypothetical protein